MYSQPTLISLHPIFTIHRNFYRTEAHFSSLAGLLFRPNLFLENSAARVAGQPHGPATSSPLHGARTCTDQLFDWFRSRTTIVHTDRQRSASSSRRRPPATAGCPGAVSKSPKRMFTQFKPIIEFPHHAHVSAHASAHSSVTAPRPWRRFRNASRWLVESDGRPDGRPDGRVRKRRERSAVSSDRSLFRSTASRLQTSTSNGHRTPPAYRRPHPDSRASHPTDVHKLSSLLSSKI